MADLRLVSRQTRRRLRARERERLGHGPVEVGARRPDRHTTAEEIRPEELRERGGRLVEAAGIADITRQRAVGIVAQLLEMIRNLGKRPVLAVLVYRMHPVRSAHLWPELRNRHLGEILLDQEEAGVDAGLGGRTPEVMMIGDVELTVGPPDGRYRARLEKVASLMLFQLLELRALVLDLDHAHGDLSRAQAVDFDLVQLGHANSGCRMAAS